jgi:hypothetical protein
MIDTEPTINAEAPIGQQKPVEATTPTAPMKWTTDQRKELLGRQIAIQCARGARVESQGDYQAVVVFGHRVNHVLHFLIGFVTFFMWWIVWVLLAITGGEKRTMLSVDEWGIPTVQKL